MNPTRRRAAGGRLGLPVIDTHCHLTFHDFAGRVADELADARARGVHGVITVSTTPQTARAGLDIARRHEGVWCTAGVHPLYAGEGPFDLDELDAVAADDRCVAWGELGLDRHYDDPPQDAQLAVLHAQLERIAAARARGLDKPVVIHCRKAFDELLPVLASSGIPGERFVFHCFTAGVDEARRVLDLGAMLSFTGVATYPNAPEVLKAAAFVPHDRIMVETDAPYLSPQPVRGQRPCRPWMVTLTAAAIADARGTTADQFEHTTDDNATRFFALR